MKKYIVSFGIFFLLCIVTACGADTAPEDMGGKHSVQEEIEEEDSTAEKGAENGSDTETLPEHGEDTVPFPASDSDAELPESTAELPDLPEEGDTPYEETETEAEDMYGVYLDAFYEQHYGGMTGEQIEALVMERTEYYRASGYYEEITDYWENVREVRDIANRLEPLFYTDMKYYTREEFQDLPEVVIHLARNEIYARRGYLFSDVDLHHYFMGCAWYQPVYSSGEFDDSVWNDYERENLKLLVELDRYNQK